jgi:hypothetical protein
MTPELSWRRMRQLRMRLAVQRAILAKRCSPCLGRLHAYPQPVQPSFYDPVLTDAVGTAWLCGL